jgi:hypothetical protein
MSNPLPPNAVIPDWVKNLVNNPDDLDELIVLKGYLGQTNDKNMIRLYLDLEFHHYLEIALNKIKWCHSMGGSELGASYIWVDPEAEIVERWTLKGRYKARFLEGRITRDYGGVGGPEDGTSTGLVGWAAPTSSPAACYGQSGDPHQAPPILGGSSRHVGCPPSSSCPTPGCPGY